MVRRGVCLALALICWLPASGFAQSTASLTGIVTDASKAVLPGATVTATDTSSGRQYASTTDMTGEYRLPAILPGTYRVQAELSGFTTVVVPSVELLVGQNASMPFALAVANVEETVTVTGEAPLIDTRAATVGTNIDRRQMQDLPILGRNWMEMSLLVKGITANTMGGNRAGMARDDQFQLNLDGQQITQNMSLADFFGQPRLSREAIAEFQQNVSGYDVTQGRSVGVTVQAVSRSGTNALHGAVYGNFRDDAFVAADVVEHEVLPFSNTQAGFSLGGPILQNKLHYFGTYEYERQPDTAVVRPQVFGGESLTFAQNRRDHNTLMRGDYQASDRDHVSVRLTHWDRDTLGGLGTGSYPTGRSNSPRYNVNIVGNWSRVINNNVVQEIRLGYMRYEFSNVPAEGVQLTPLYDMPSGFPDVGPSRSYPQEWFQRTPSIRYDLTWHKGSHDMKLGGEFLDRLDGAFWPNESRGIYTVDGYYDNGVKKNLTAAEFARRFPLAAWGAPSQWDLVGLSASRFRQNFSNDFMIDLPRKTWAIWAADTWAVNDRLTVNYGLRWDVDWGAQDPPGSVDLVVPITNGKDPAGSNLGYTSGIRNLGNIAPRGGVTFKVDDTLVLRGGAGLFYTFPESNSISGPQQQINNTLHKVIGASFENSVGEAFFANPLGGLTGEQILAGGGPTVRVNLRNLDPDFQNPRTFQATAGFQKQVSSVFAFDSDLLYTKGMHLATDRNVNLFYDPVTGYPKNPAAVSQGGFGVPNPSYGTIRYWESDLESESLKLASSVTRRLRDNWQAGATYTLTLFDRDMGSSAFGYIASFSNPFCTECEWGRSDTFQRHTVRLNAIYDAPWGIQLASIYAFGSGNPQSWSYRGSSLSPVGTGSGTTGSFGINRYVTDDFSLPESVTYPDGSVHQIVDLLEDGTPTSYTAGQELERNALKGYTYSKLDLRASKSVGIPGTSVRVTGMLEVFNLFNTANWAGSNTTANLGGFAEPTFAYAPRTGQLAFRVEF